MGLAFLEVHKIYFWTSKNIPESPWLKYASESPQNFPRISSDHLLVIAKKKNRTFFLRNLLWDYRPWEALYDWSTRSEDFCTKLSKSEFPTRSAINLPCLDWVCPCCTVYHLFQQMCNNDDDIGGKEIFALFKEKIAGVGDTEFWLNQKRNDDN